MTKPMTQWGVGPRWGVFSLAYATVAFFVTRAFPVFRIPDTVYPALTVLGILMLVIGFPIYVMSARAILKAFASAKLVTDGVYGICRHPMYGSWILFIVPGIELLLRSWLGLTTSIVMYMLLRVMVTKEEDYLADKFGDDYRKYKARVPFVCPVGWLTAKR